MIGRAETSCWHAFHSSGNRHLRRHSESLLSAQELWIVTSVCPSESGKGLADLLAGILLLNSVKHLSWPASTQQKHEEWQGGQPLYGAHIPTQSPCQCKHGIGCSTPKLAACAQGRCKQKAGLTSLQASCLQPRHADASQACCISSTAVVQHQTTCLLSRG